MAKLLNVKFNALILFLAILGVGFFLGWITGGKNNSSNTAATSSRKALPLRLESNGYKFINPLLLCDANPDKDSSDLLSFKDELSNFIDEEKQKNNVAAISVYFRDLKKGSQAVINPDEKFHPASLGKIPVMIAYFKMAESKPEILQSKISANIDKDLNSQQEIKSKNYIKNGEQYTVEELIEKMIKDSDNNALSILSSNLLIDVDALKAVYQDLEVPFLADPANQQNPEKFDFMTTNNFSYFFRALYNGTYLDREYSEKALQILSDVDFKDGLVAGIPNGISISHKFGLESVAPNGFVITSRELHDCGIIYYPQTPYLLCVMTKSDSSIPSMETAIKNISSFVYKKVDNQYK